MIDSIHEFLDYLIDEKRYSDHTETNYEVDLLKFSDYLKNNKLNYLKIKYQDLSDYIVYLRKANYLPTTINRNLSSLRSFYSYLTLRKKISNNPFSLVKGVKETKRLPNYFKYSEFEIMIEVLKEETPLNIRNRLILELLFGTGMRVSELVNIKLLDLDLKQRQIKVKGKGSKDRIVFLNNYTIEALTLYLNNSRNLLLKNKKSEYLLLNNLGGNLTDRGVRLIIEQIIKKASIKTKITPHTFRHSFATIMLNQGCNIKSVQELLGHSSLDTTSIYTHLTNNEIRNAYLKNHPRAKIKENR